MTLSPAAREYVLTLADDDHMIGARHTAWIGLGPFLEEDLAFCSIAQDELGHAISLYRLTLDPTDDTSDAAIDAIALDRTPSEYRSSWLAEIPCDDWASALVRHWLYDRAEELRMSNIAASTVAELAALVPGIQREESFHLSLAQQLMSRVLPGGKDQIVQALSDLLPLAATLWIPPENEAAALSEGVAEKSFAQMEADWNATVRSDLSSWGIDKDSIELASIAVPSDRRIRSDSFVSFHEELNAVRSIDATAVW